MAKSFICLLLLARIHSELYISQNSIFFRKIPKLHIPKLEEALKAPKVIRVNEFDEEGLDGFEKDMDDAHQSRQPIIPIIPTVEDMKISDKHLDQMNKRMMKKVAQHLGQ